MGGFGINLPMKVDMSFNKETKPNCIYIYMQRSFNKQMISLKKKKSKRKFFSDSFHKLKICIVLNMFKAKIILISQKY